MCKVLDWVMFTFSNLDCACVPAEHILNFSIHDISKCMFNVPYSKEVIEYEYAKYIYFEFDDFIDNICYTTSVHNRCNLVDRFNTHKDVVSVDLLYLDGVHEIYYVDWSKEKEEINLFQIYNNEKHILVITDESQV